MSALSEKNEHQIKAWHAHAHSAMTDAMHALYQCYLMRSYCSRLEQVLFTQRLKMGRQLEKLWDEIENPRLSRYN